MTDPSETTATVPTAPDPSGFDALAKAVEGFINNAQKASTETDRFNKQLTDLKSTVQNNKDSISKFIDPGKIESTITLVKQLGEAIISSAIAGQHASETFAGFATDAKLGFVTTAETFAPIKGVLTQITSLTGNIPEVGMEIEKMITGVTDGIDLMIRNAQAIRGVEDQFIQLAVARGQLSDVFDIGGASSQNLTDKTHNLIEQTKNLSLATGFSVTSLNQLRSTLGEIPGAMNSSSDSTTEWGGTLDVVNAATRVSVTTLGGLPKVQLEIKEAYEKMGLSAGDAVKYIGALNTVSEFSKLTFNDVRSVAEEVANKFGMLGDQSNSTLNILQRFGPTFREIGLSSTQSAKLINEMVDGIKGLDTGSKAFISSRSGGPGGLQGAFKIDNLIQQGKLDEVMKMAQDTFKRQLGGNIVSREQAGQDPRAAAQYQRQLSLAKSTPFGAMVKDNDSAARFFDALKTGTLGTGEVRGKQDLFEISSQRGKNVQDDRKTALTAISASITKIQQESLANITRILGVIAGKGNPIVEKVLNSLSQDATQAVGASLQDSTAPQKGGLFPSIKEAGATAKLFISGKEKHHEATRPDKPLPTITRIGDTDKRDMVRGRTTAPLSPVITHKQHQQMAAQQIQRPAEKSPSAALTDKTVRSIQNVGTGGGAGTGQNQARLGAQEVKFPDSLKITGQLEVKCIDCGRVNDKGKIIAEVESRQSLIPRRSE